MRWWSLLIRLFHTTGYPCLSLQRQKLQLWRLLRQMEHSGTILILTRSKPSRTALWSWLFKEQIMSWLSSLFHGGNSKNPADAAMPYLNQVPGVSHQGYDPYI